MHDIRAIRDDPDSFAAGLQRRNVADSRAITDEILACDRDLRALLTRLQEAQARRNEASKLIGRAKAQKDEAAAQALMSEVAGLKDEIQRGEDEQRQHDADQGGRQQRRPRMEPEGRRGEPEGPPHPVKRESDNKLRQRELGSAAPARLLPETADHRPSLPASQAGQQVDRDPSRQTFDDALKPGHVMRSRHEVATSNADHGCDHSPRSIHTRTPKNHTGSPRRRISSTEYNATVCHVHGK